MSHLAPRLTPATIRPATAKITTTLRSMPQRGPIFHATGGGYHSQSPSCSNDTARGAVSVRERVERSFEDIFIHSLILASSCQHHRQGSTNPLQGAKGRPLAISTASAARQCRVRLFSSRPPREREAMAVAPSSDISRDEYKHLVNTYPSFDFESQPGEVESAQKLPTRQRQHHPLAPRLVLTPAQELGHRQREWQALPAEDKEHKQQIKHLAELLKKPLGYVPPNALWVAYEKLRAPRLRYLTVSRITRLFAHLSWVEFRSLGTMERYFALLNECIGEQVPLNEMVWNSAIDFAGRWSRHATSKEIKAAIEIWMRMERSGHQATNVTFNILFQVAVRSGRFALADTILDELKVREMPLDRYLRSSLIYYAGARRDGEGIRQAFHELVNAGEIVDTGVMNVVILSFFRAGEAPAAEHTFYRMKQLHKQKFGTTAPKEWQSRKELTQLLTRTGARLREEQREHEASFFGAPFSTAERREEIQRASPIAPNAVTYQILIKYHTYTSGDIDRIRSLLVEMQERDLHVHGSVYVHLLRGFHTHGGYALSPWSRGSLEDLWSEILTVSSSVVPARKVTKSSGDSSDLLGAMISDAAINEDNGKGDDDGRVITEQERPLYFTRALALAALHAFYKCTGKKRMLEIWHEISARWKDASDDDKTRVEEVVQRMVAEDSIYID